MSATNPNGRPRSTWYSRKPIGTGIDPSDGVLKFMVLVSRGIDEQQPDGTWVSVESAIGGLIYTTTLITETSGCSPVTP